MAKRVHTPPFATTPQRARTIVTVRCDGCRDEVCATADADTTSEALELGQRMASREAEDRGWRVDGEAARCPRCRGRR